MEAQEQDPVAILALAAIHALRLLVETVLKIKTQQVTQLLFTVTGMQVHLPMAMPVFVGAGRADHLPPAPTPAPPTPTAPPPPPSATTAFAGKSNPALQTPTARIPFLYV